MITVLIADDHELVRAGIRYLLEEAIDIKIVGEAASGMETIAEFKRTRPDVVILDISMPALDGIDTCKRLKALYPKSNILVLSVHPEEQYAVRLINAGANGYVNKRISCGELQTAIRTVAQGGVYLPQNIRGQLLSQLMRTGPRSDVLEALSDRESQVFNLLARGKKMKEIALELGLSAKTER
jgi:DNA-binding NarL/FixJ family response regulator